MSFKILYHNLWNADGYITRVMLILGSVLWGTTMLLRPEPFIAQPYNTLLAIGFLGCSYCLIYQLTFGKLCGVFPLITSFLMGVMWLSVTWIMVFSDRYGFQFVGELILTIMALWIFVKTPSSGKECAGRTCYHHRVCNSFHHKKEK
jgi:uncharacterized membrane protein